MWETQHYVKVVEKGKLSERHPMVVNPSVRWYSESEGRVHYFSCFSVFSAGDQSQGLSCAGQMLCYLATLSR